MAAAACVAALACAARADITAEADYTVLAGGSAPIAGLSAHGKFTVSGTTLTVELSNTTPGQAGNQVGAGYILASVGLTLPVDFVNTMSNSAKITAGSVGIGAWSALGAGADVGTAWLWTNLFGGDEMISLKHIISTSQGQGGGDTFSFDWDYHGNPGNNKNPNVNSPWGGMAPPGSTVNNNVEAVRNSITFVLELNGGMTQLQLDQAVAGSMVEFGSDGTYLVIPAPGAALLATLGLGFVGFTRRRRL
ncbi:MAG: hypothetical protein C4547_08985 [Phycisphaerales bacterium]|nr:MAG: hypothetical protein C4547_08985 [Phycisphaerales bacterium]